MDKVLKRTPPLAQAAFANAAVAIAPCAPMTRLVLQMNENDARELARVGKFQLDIPINRAVVDGGHISARLGPGEWLLVSPGEADDTQEVLARWLGERFHSLVDISHRNYAFDISGAAAAQMINGACPLDLGARAFPTLSATRTLLGKATIVLVRFDDRYRIECWRSFAPYVFELLRHNALEFGDVTDAL